MRKACEGCCTDLLDWPCVGYPNFIQCGTINSEKAAMLYNL